MQPPRKPKPRPRPLKPRQPSCSARPDRKSTRLNSSHLVISYAVFCLKKNNEEVTQLRISGHRFGVWTALLTFTAALVAACGGGTNNTATTDDMKGTITVAYSTTYVFDSDDQSVIWWDKVKKEFEQQYPNAKLNLQGFNGTDVDLVNKVALEYKNPSTTPDVFMLPTGYVGQWVGSDYLRPLDSS